MESTAILPYGNMKVISFYQFRTLTDLPRLQKELQKLCADLAIKGTIILAEEGINGTIVGTEASIQAFLANPYFPDLTYKTATVPAYPFQKLKIKIKPEIITLGTPIPKVQECTGVYVPPRQWNELLQEPDLLLIDTRNEYEVSIGTFRGAVNPHLDSFRQFPDFVTQHLDPHQHRKIAMYCTGGIRCEKASALMLQMGFAEVYQLQGGILQYLAEIPPDQSLWQGECFVFDDRTSVDHDLQTGNYQVIKGAVYPKLWQA
jgi:UPF0176 protein